MIQELIVGTEAAQRTSSATRKSTPWWLWPNVISLEPPLVGIAWCVLSLQTVHHQVKAIPVAILALSIWLVYLLDHLFDTRGRERDAAEPGKKRFVRSHRRAVAALAGVLVTVIAIASLQVFPWPLLGAGSTVATLVGLYLASVQLLPGVVRSTWPREGAVAALFSVGVHLPAWSAAGPEMRWPIALSALNFGVLCWINCCAVQVLEWQRWGGSAGQRPGRVAVTVDRWMPFLACFVLLATFLPTERRAVGLASLVSVRLSCLGFFLLAGARRRSRHGEVSAEFLALWADVSMLSPILVLVGGLFDGHP